MEDDKVKIFKKYLPFIALAIIIVLVIIIIFLVFKINSINIKYEKLDGFWKASNNFCKESDINSLMLYISAENNKLLNCYLIITDDICNQEITIKILNKNKDKSYNIQTKFSESDIWPEYAIMEVDDGKLVIYNIENDEKVLYLKVYKQNEINHELTE